MQLLNELTEDVQRYSQNPLPWILVGIIIALAIILLLIHSYLTSPFKYPHYEHDFDLTLPWASPGGSEGGIIPVRTKPRGSLGADLIPRSLIFKSGRRQFREPPAWPCGLTFLTGQSHAPRRLYVYPNANIC